MLVYTLTEKWIAKQNFTSAEWADVRIQYWLNEMRLAEDLKDAHKLSAIGKSIQTYIRAERRRKQPGAAR